MKKKRFWRSHTQLCWTALDLNVVPVHWFFYYFLIVMALGRRPLIQRHRFTNTGMSVLAYFNLPLSHITFLFLIPSQEASAATEALNDRLRYITDAVLLVSFFFSFYLLTGKEKNDPHHDVSSKRNQLYLFTLFLCGPFLLLLIWWPTRFRFWLRKVSTAVVSHFLSIWYAYVREKSLEVRLRQPIK